MIQAYGPKFLEAFESLIPRHVLERESPLMKDDVAEKAWAALTEEEQAHLMDYAARRMQPGMLRAIAETGVAYFDPREMVDLPYPGSEPLAQEETDAVGYVCAVDRDARTVTVSMARVAEAVADMDVPYWLYHFAVELGAQPPVADIWPELAGRRLGMSSVASVARHFYASKPPDR